MIRFRPNSRNYFQTGGSAYIGSGNRMSVFTRRSRPAFSKIKQIYGDHMEALKVEHHELRPHHPDVGKLRKKVLTDIKKENIRFIRKQIMAFLLSFMIVALLLFVGWRIIIAFYPNFG